MINNSYFILKRIIIIIYISSKELFQQNVVHSILCCVQYTTSWLSQRNTRNSQRLPVGNVFLKKQISFGNNQVERTLSIIWLNAAAVVKSDEYVVTE